MVLAAGGVGARPAGVAPVGAAHADPPRGTRGPADHVGVVAATMFLELDLQVRN
jgi:hypothetical protein